MADQMIVRSYRRVFRVDRRIYRVDRWALPVPGGIPLRGLGYFAVALVAILVLEALPVTGALVGAVTAPLRYVVAPLALAVLAAQASPDGRPAHRVARDWLVLRLRARRRSAGRRVPREGERFRWDGVVLTRSDEHSPHPARRPGRWPRLGGVSPGGQRRAESARCPGRATCRGWRGRGHRARGG
jgi:hypothetical protein